MADHHAIEPELVVAWLEELRDKGLLFEERTPPADPSVDWNRYARQIDLFAAGESVEVSRFDRQRRLHDSHVLQVGLGGLGTWIAQNLALAGIGRLTLVDGDIVDQTNLNRQVLYRPADVGAPKVVAAGRAIKQLNPEIRVFSHRLFIGDASSLEALIGDVTLAVVCADEPFLYLRRWITEACFGQGIPHLFVSASMVGPLVDPQRRLPCWLCQEAALRETVSDFPHWLEQIKQRHVTRSPQSVFPGYHSVLAGLVTMEAIRYLSDFEPPQTLGQVLRWDVGQPALTREPLAVHRDCDMRH